MSLSACFLNSFPACRKTRFSTSWSEEYRQADIPHFFAFIVAVARLLFLRKNGIIGTKNHPKECVAYVVDLRKEYPRPQLVRETWLCLNGTWEFEIDSAEVGVFKEYWNREKLNGTITVPYCPESVLSGVGHTDFMNCVWYRKVFSLPSSFDGKHTILHFGAVDYEAMVFVNGQKVGGHQGGFTPFSFDITPFLKEGENVLMVCALDHERSAVQPLGKQSDRLHSYGCFYTRVTGIWQTVWLEPVEEAHLLHYRVYPDLSNTAVTVQVTLPAAAAGMTLRIKARYQGKDMGEAAAKVQSRAQSLTLYLKEAHLWEIGQGRLYDLSLMLLREDGTPLDQAEGYFGLREVGLCTKGMTLNGKVFFGRYVLDQGYYPDGIYTAPSDEALKKDIEYGQRLGFNGARMHQKIFEPRYLYWADRLGYLVWGEFPNWGLPITRFDALKHFLPEWLEAMERDFSHPALIGWCPFNETWDDKKTGSHQCDMVLQLAYQTTKAVDPTRPVVDTSGNFHVRTDFFDVHDYEQDPALFKENYAKIGEGIVNDQVNRRYPGRQKYEGGPVFVSEYGGIKWNTAAIGDGWGYGKEVQTEEEFIARYRGLTEALLENPFIMGFCYTQLYDVEQECNGLMTYDRRYKFDADVFQTINQQKAAIED